MLGTGFADEPREPVRGAIEAVNRAAAAGVTVVAADVPSGVDASSGEVHGGEAVRADVTVTFHAAKPGLWISPGKDHAGEVVVAGIGVPRGAPGQPEVGLIEPAVLDEIPRRDAASTKFVGGSVLVCGGSRGLTGAPSLSAEAAMRAGAGYVTAAVPASVHHVFELRLLEVMTVALEDEETAALGPGAVEEVLERAGKVGALVLGPGAGRAEATLDAVRTIAARAPVPLLLDADGLNAHAGHLDDLATREAATVLTPHAGELGRLLERSSEEIGRARLASVREAAKRAQAVVVLKGDDTLVADPGGRVAVNRGGSPALATAGTGDVLSGVVGAFLSKGLGPFTAAAAGVYVHARAGQIAPGAHGPDGVIASDVIAALPAALTG
jgi:NAD(P)H-hydrate epimerase